MSIPSMLSPHTLKGRAHYYLDLFFQTTKSKPILSKKIDENSTIKALIYFENQKQIKEFKDFLETHCKYALKFEILEE
ncbi:MAG: hypothetical protein ACFFCI_00580 [Promethearchaeota archaeon]